MFESVVKLKGYKPVSFVAANLVKFESVVKLKGYKPTPITHERLVEFESVVKLKGCKQRLLIAILMKPFECFVPIFFVFSIQFSNFYKL